MTRILLAFGVTLALAACGADGAPIRPTLNAGLGISNSGLHLGGAVGVRKGPVSLRVGL